MARRKPDYILLGTILVLLILGLAALFSASVPESHRDFGNIHSYFLHQLTYGVGLGLIFSFILYKIPYKQWKALALPALLIAIFSLILVLIPSISLESGGARRWINVAGFSFQPSELAKLGFVIYLAAWLEARRVITKHWNEGFVPFVVIVGIFGFLIILQPDVGTLGVIALTAIFMYFIAGASFGQIGTLVGLGLGLLFVLVKAAPYRAERITAFLDRSIDPLGISYQINQALLAIGSGGLLGLGLGKGIQKQSFLPEPMKDSVFAVWSEEAGFIGGALLIIAFLILGFRGLRIAKNSRDKFGKYLAAGITFWIISQAFINIGSMLGILPLTGIPLPLISYGGSAMVVSLAGLGILANISKYS
jgi:cell division protein FtsW